jgi:hypothetical protein
VYDQQILQFAGLVRKPLKPPCGQDIQPALFGFPIVKRRIADAMLAAQIGRLRPEFLLLQNPDDLLLGKP